MSVIIRHVWPLFVRVFNNQKGPVCLGDVDGKTYLGDLAFFHQCGAAENELKDTILLKEGEILIEDAESGEAAFGEVPGTAAG